MRLDALDNLFGAFDIGRLNVDRAHRELPVAEATLVVRRHIVLDEKAVAFDLADEVGLVAPVIEIAVADLTVIIGADGVVALADMNHHMHILGKILDREVDRIDGRRDG